MSGTHNHESPASGATPAGDGASPSRASQAERESTEEALRAAVVEGRITLDEFGDRIAAAYTVMSSQELALLTADVPAVAPPSSRAKKSAWIFGILGGDDRVGRWTVARKCWVINVMGGADLDLRAATVSGPVTEITVFSIMGGSDIIVPDGVDVEPSGFAVFGGNDAHLSDTPAQPGAPLMRIRAFSLMGGTDIKQGTGAQAGLRGLCD